MEIEGPEKPARMAAEFSRSLSACVATTDPYTLGEGANLPLSDSGSARIRRFLNRAASKRTQFVTHARKTIDTRSGHGPGPEHHARRDGSATASAGPHADRHPARPLTAGPEPEPV